MKRKATSSKANDLSDYEVARLENIARNTAELKRLGLHVNKLTRLAQGAQKPTMATKRKRAVPPKSRWSSRLSGMTPINYKVDTSRFLSRKKQRISDKSSSISTVIDDDDQLLPKTSTQSSTSNTSANSSSSSCSRSTAKSNTNQRSIKNLKVDLKHLNNNFLGEIIPPLGGQVKRAAMMECAPTCSPTFSRMSGIQEWKNSICLFVNVYGDGYKNVFLENGRFITWFAQNRQWEGTPVIQRLINCHGGQNLEGNEVKSTPILLFCRNKGKGYVYCGQLGYSGHDPDRIPIRFVWELLDFDVLSKGEPFQDLITACEEMFQYRSNPLAASVPNDEFLLEEKEGIQLLGENKKRKGKKKK
jgi:hypothetical protein